MGGRKETPPTIIMPAEGAPQAFQTIVPQKSYKDMAESTLRTEKEINRLMGQRYNEVGTPEEIGARKKGVEMQAAASYLSSLPKGPVDERFKETPRAFPVNQIEEQLLTQFQDQCRVLVLQDREQVDHLQEEEEEDK